jgi:sortase A
MKKIRKIIGTIAIAAGVVLLLGAAYIFIDEKQMEKKQTELASQVLSSLQDTQVDSDSLTYSMPTKTIDGQEYVGVLYIPDLNKELPILSICTNESLDLAPGRYSGTTYEYNMVIGGHATQANFYSISELENGTQVYFQDFNDMVWKYELVDTEILYPSQTDDLTQSAYPLSLFTCTYDNSKRTVLRFRLLNTAN